MQFTVGYKFTKDIDCQKNLKKNAKDKYRQEYIARINKVMDYIEKHLIARVFRISLKILKKLY